MKADTTTVRQTSQIETLCEAYDRDSAILDTMIAQLEADLHDVRQKHMARLKRQAACVAASEASVRLAVEERPDLFAKPRTAVFHGIKVGYQKAEGVLVADDDQATINRLKDMYLEDEIEKYVTTKESLNKRELKNLSADDLNDLGLRIDGAGDVVLVKRVSGDVEKLIDRLIEKLVTAITAEN